MKYDYVDIKTGANASHFVDKLFIYGTHDDTDVHQDLKMWPVFKHGIAGHAGAYYQAEYLYNNVDWSMVNELHGHSLGGAVALWLGIMTGISVTTYGSFRPFYVPRKCNAKNYIYGFDIVPRLGFFRGGETIKIKCSGFHPFTDHLRYQQLEVFYEKVVT